MTEYLIILAVVAIAAIAIIGLFGQQIKSVFVKSTGALQGSVVSGGDATTSAATASTMSSFNK
jgi:Flp pilus assembly pilin Flp